MYVSNKLLDKNVWSVSVYRCSRSGLNWFCSY